MKRLIANIKGVTLIELIVVITIIAIGAAIAVPNMSGWMARTKLNAEARKVYSVFQQARSEAIKRNSDVAVRITWATNTYDSYLVSTTGIVFTPPTTMPKGFTLGPTQGTQTTWEYTSRGTFITGDDAKLFYIQSDALPSTNNKKSFTFTLGGTVTISH
jgi:prepilin-type N-terminal cleavage/methylation domain-containing protein